MAYDQPLSQRIEIFNVSSYMKKVFFNMLILFSMMITASTGCSDDANCTSGQVDISDLEDFGCTNSAFTVTVMTLNEFELIRNQDDFDLHIDAKCDPTIDWV